MTDTVLAELSKVIKHRKDNFEEGSYTCYLFQQGIDKILKKCGEECSEMIIAAKNNDKKNLSEEIGDLVFHVMVLMAETGVPVEMVEAVLKERSEKMGNLKTFHTVDKNS